MEWDVFISHASEDKDAFVRPLAETLAQLGLKVWYDEFTLQPGDSISRSIDKGLANSRVGLVVLSESFISKPWPEHELKGLVALEIAEQMVIIPIWLGLSSEDVRRFSPTLADSLALKVSGMAAEEVAISIVKRVRPDIYSKYPRLDLERMAKGNALEKLQMELNKVKDELRELIVTEIRNVMKVASNRVVNMPVTSDFYRALSPEGMKEREARKKIAREVTGVIIEATEDYLREAQARVIEKTDPQRAEIVRRLKPTF